MQNFVFHNPTRIVLGRHTIPKLRKLIPSGSRVMLAYGHGSIKQNGVYDQITQALNGFETIEFSGIDPNPKYEQLLPGLELIQKHRIQFILAAGGGSVIDAVKWLAAAALYEGDPWDILTGQYSVKEALPIGTVLTLPGTGSEANGNAVISRIEPLAKRSFYSPAVFPRFSILDPETTFSLPKHQIANGVADAFTHVVEQYLTYPVGGHLQDRLAEAVFHTLIEQGVQAVESTDYEIRANFMWACTLALNTLLSMGVPGDWASHQIGHELTALHGLDHARTLAIVLPSLLREQKDSKREKLLQFGDRIWGIRSGSESERIEQTIQAVEKFFRSLGIGVRFSEYDLDARTTPQEVANRLRSQGSTAIGEHNDITPDKVQRILEAAA
ncbi:MAG: iron-containing alcohol dehydrogenase [Puniceicoccaceae bacterium]